MKCNMCDKDKSFGELKYIGLQELDGKAFALYNCKECNSTLASHPKEETKIIKVEDRKDKL